MFFTWLDGLAFEMKKTPAHLLRFQVSPRCPSFHPPSPLASHAQPPSLPRRSFLSSLWHVHLHVSPTVGTPSFDGGAKLPRTSSTVTHGPPRPTPTRLTPPSHQAPSVRARRSPNGRRLGTTRGCRARGVLESVQQLRRAGGAARRAAPAHQGSHR